MSRWHDGDFVRVGCDGPVGIVLRGFVRFHRGQRTETVSTSSPSLRPATALEYAESIPSDADVIEYCLATGEPIEPGIYRVDRTIRVTRTTSAPTEGDKRGT